MKLSLLLVVLLAVAANGKKHKKNELAKRSALLAKRSAPLIVKRWIRDPESGLWQEDPLRIGFNIFGFGAGIDIDLFKDGAILTLGGDITAFGEKIVGLSVEMFGKHGLGFGANAEVLGIINAEAGWGIGGQYGLYGKKLKIGVGDMTIIGAEYGIGGKYGIGVGAGVSILGHDIKVVELGLGGVTILNQQIVPGLGGGGSSGGGSNGGVGPHIKLKGRCPKTHPVAYKNGGKCCQHKTTCRGDGIRFTSDCCYQHAWQQCKSSPCGDYVNPGNVFMFQAGDGKSSLGEVDVGETDNAYECAEKCQEKQKSDHRINGATFGLTNKSDAKKCFCEYLMYSKNKNPNYATALLPIVNGVCVTCSCEDWDVKTKRYSKCKGYSGECKSGYCAQCMSNGVTPMPGLYTTHADECVKYEEMAKLGPAFSPLGCYVDHSGGWFQSPRAIPGGHQNFDAKDVVRSCYEKARKAGYSHFAIQNNVECFTSANAGSRYNIYGSSTKCRNGRGGGWANNVYKINPGGYHAE